MVLNRNPDNFFAETEQVAFRPSNVVSGIDFSDDPLLQGRLFSYHDSQIHRLGSPNFIHLPINRPVCPFGNHNQDGRMQMEIKTSRVNYSPNTLGNNQPAPATVEQGAFTHFPERVEGHKVRERSPSFADHFSQATLFWNSLSSIEKDHLVKAAHFELGKVKNDDIRQRMLERFSKVDTELTARIAEGLGMPAPAKSEVPNHGKKSAALSQEHTTKTVQGRKVAILAANGVDSIQLTALKQSLSALNMGAEVVSKFGGEIHSAEGNPIKVDQTFLTTTSVLYDAIYVPGGTQSIKTLNACGEAQDFVHEAFKHFKPIAASAEGVDLLMNANLKNINFSKTKGGLGNEFGVITNRDVSGMESFVSAFIEAIKEHRHWKRSL